MIFFELKLIFNQLYYNFFFILAFLPDCKPSGTEMVEKMWQNPYQTTPESSLPPSRRLSDGRIELNRPRWGSVWAQET